MTNTGQKRKMVLSRRTCTTKEDGIVEMMLGRSFLVAGDLCQSEIFDHLGYHCCNWIVNFYNREVAYEKECCSLIEIDQARKQKNLTRGTENTFWSILIEGLLFGISFARFACSWLLVGRFLRSSLDWWLGVRFCLPMHWCFAWCLWASRRMTSIHSRHYRRSRSFLWTFSSRRRRRRRSFDKEESTDQVDVSRTFSSLIVRLTYLWMMLWNTYQRRLVFSSAASCSWWQYRWTRIYDESWHDPNGLLCCAFHLSSPSNPKDV